MSGLAVVGRDRYGVFPLRGKVANPRDANHEQIMKNEEIKNLKLILGLQQGNKYENGPVGLRYGHVMIMADQDPDGSHIKGLLINLFHYYWPNLLRFPGFLQEFATPIVKAKKKSGKQVVSFFTLQQYEEWRANEAERLSTWTIKYYKGLGTSSSQEAKEYFSNLTLHEMNFAWEGAEDGEIIEMVFSKKRADDRKQWLLKYKEDVFVDHNASEVTYSDFVNKELIHFSMMDNTVLATCPHLNCLATDPASCVCYSTCLMSLPLLLPHAVLATALCLFRRPASCMRPTAHSPS